MHNLVLVKLWSDFGKAPHFEVRRLLESFILGKTVDLQLDFTIFRLPSN